MMLPAVTVIGTGALGSTLAKALRSQQVQIKSVYNRTATESELLSEAVDSRYYGSFPADACELGCLIFLTVQDDAISAAAKKLASLQEDWTDYSIVHCSGNETSAVLQPLKDKGALVAAFHPLQTFTKESLPTVFKDIYFNVEGDSELISLLMGLAKLLGAKAFEISPEAKSYLHAAAVMASNYLVALLHASEQVAEMGGLDPQEVRKSLIPLVRQSLENVTTGKLHTALSGPVARGDCTTVRRHLDLIQPREELSELYRQLGRQALQLAKQKGTIVPERLEELEKLLSS
jgi:predicted short-subunit dehydrogenase-like oxidoreductase (DUF2520 family)